jgi:DNA-directed RNA polymerase specialized sigma24 family protein
MGEADPVLAVLARLERVDRAARDLQAELDALPERTRITRSLLGEGHTLSEALRQSPGPASHERVAERAERYAEALHAYRCAIVRHLVDVEGRSLTEIAERIGCARQVVSRLYHARRANGGRPGPKLRLRSDTRAGVGAR